MHHRIEQCFNFLQNNCQHNGAIYATVDVSKKKKHAEPLPTPSSSNYMNLEPAGGGGKQQQPTTACNARKPTENYMNLEFSESLCYYENAKNVLTKAGLSNACDKCGHQKRCSSGGADEKGDYMTMEPVNGRMVETKRNQFPGYLPMCPTAAGNNNNNNGSSSSNNNNKQQDMLKNIMNRGLAEKSASIPSLNEYKSTAATVNGNDWKNVGGAADDPHRRRSSSADSSRCDDDGLTSVIGAERSSRGAGCSDHTSSTESMTSQIAKRPTDATSAGATSTASTVSDGSVTADDQQTALVHIRRSSSVPCKNNRDSSSSNDSGVSTGSLRYRGADFAEFELPLTTAMSTMRHRRTVAAATAAATGGSAAGSIDCGGRVTVTGCVHGSLPRRSKSTDRLKELSFRFQKFSGTMKSSSAGAEVPVCLKKDKGQL